MKAFKLFIGFFVAAVLLGTSAVFAAAPDGLGPWADAVVDYSPGLRDNGTPIDPARAIPESALGVAEDNDSINFTALGYGGSLTLSFENGIANGPGADFRVVETTYNNRPCNEYPERATLEVSEDGVTWYDAVTANDCQDLEFDLEELDLQCILYVRITDTSVVEDFANENHITDGYDVDGVKALHEGNCQPEQDFDYQCSAGILYLDSHSSAVSSDLYLVDVVTGAAEYKKTYEGDYRNTLAADADGNVFAFDRATEKLVQLMPDGTTVDVVDASSLPASSNTFTIAPDGTFYVALENDDLYAFDPTTGSSTLVAALGALGVDVTGGDIDVDENNVMTIMNAWGQVWTVDLSDLTTVYLGSTGLIASTGMTYFDGKYYLTHDSTDSLYYFTHAAVPGTLVDSLGTVIGSGDAGSCAVPRLDASIEVEKSAEGYVDPFEVNFGEEVTYTFEVTNTGEVPVSNIDVVDDICGDGVYQSGDVNNNSKLDVDETWLYTCTQTMDEPGLVINTVTVTGNDPFGDPVDPADDSLETTVKNLGCTLTQGYWKTHGDPLNEKKYDEAWGELVLPGTVFTDPSVLELMLEKPKGNYWYMLYSQYVAAKLNSLNAYTPDDVAYALLLAENLLTEENRDALEVKGKNKNKQLHSWFVAVNGILASYNEGGTEVPHCSES